MVGAEAAGRLAALDAQRSAWRERVADYRSARTAIETDPALDAHEREQAIARIQAERFNDSERVRVQALDEIDRH